MPLATPARIVSELASRGYNADREAVTLLAGAPDPDRALARAIEATPEDALTVPTEQVRMVVDDARAATDRTTDERATDDRTPNDDRDNTNADHSTVDHDHANTDRDNPNANTDRDNPNANADHDNSNSNETARTDGSRATQSHASDDHAPESPTENPSQSSTDSSRNTLRENSSPAKSPASATDHPPEHPSVSSGESTRQPEQDRKRPPETEGSPTNDSSRESGSTTFERSADSTSREIAVTGDMTGRSTGTGTYSDFVTTFRDRYERLSGLLRSRVNHRPTEAVHAMAGGSDAAMIGMISDIRSTANGHWLVELEDTTGTFPCLVLKDRELASVVDELLLDEVIAVEGSLAGDGGILFVDDLHFPDVPRTYTPSTADRHVRAALVSDVHVGSQEFRADAWGRFADWLHGPEAAEVEYLLLAGDMVEGVGVYPGQDEELDIVDLYGQYERFAELLKQVPGDLDIVMIPGNHDAVRLAEPQPGFDEELRNIMSAHDARITSNPSTVTLEGVTFLLYHGVSLDEVIAELPEEKASYDNPHHAMAHLLKKRHVAPQYGGHTRLAPEDRDYLVMEEVPDVFHTGHVHKLGYGKYHDVLSINSGCWQDQTSFQESVNIEPDVGYAPIVDLDTLDLTIQKFT